MDNYNKEKEFKEEIEPLLREVLVRCNMYGIPMFATFAVANTETETIYKTKVLHAVLNHRLTENVIHTLLLRINGFEHDYPDSVKEQIRGLTQYLEQMQTNFDEAVMEKKVQLSEDRIPDMTEIVKGKRKVKLSTEKLPDGQDMEVNGIDGK